MRGRCHGAAVTDEVALPPAAAPTSSVCSASLRSQLSLIGEASAPPEAFPYEGKVARSAG